MKESSFDAVVVGSGAGGAAAAYALCDAGAKVLLLEAGPRFDPQQDYRLESNEWEQTKFPYKRGSQVRYTVADLQELDDQHHDLRSWNRNPDLFPQGKRRRSAGYEHLQAVGGSTLRYTGEAHRLNPVAMKLQTDFGVGADWPISYADIEPYYVMAERLIGVAGESKEQMRPRSAPYPLPPHERSYASQLLGNGFDALDLSWTSNPLAALTETYDGRPPCNQCGQCALGCSRLDKGSADLTFVAKALATKRCELRVRCRATEILTNVRDEITGIQYIDKEGATHQAVAKKYFIAAGAVETPRLLLNSVGIIDDEGHLGRHFMETLSWNSNALHPDKIGSHRGHPSDSICWDFNAPNAIEDVIGGCRFSLGVAESGLTGPISYANRVVGGWGRSAKMQVRDLFGRVIGIGAIGESLPNEKSFIDLDPEIKDHLGLPVARIHSYLDEMAIRRIRFMAEKSREILAATGAGEIFEEYGTYDLFHSTHVFGGCRMGSNASDSFVNADQRAHRYKNLYLVDASVFPSTGGGESPALTISALALRAVERALVV